MVGKGKETSEAQSSFNDSVLQNSDLSLLGILQSLQNESGSVSEASNPPMTCTSTAGLIYKTKKTQHFICSQSCFKVSKTIRLNGTHYFIIKIANKSIESTNSIK